MGVDSVRNQRPGVVDRVVDVVVDVLLIAEVPINCLSSEMEKLHFRSVSNTTSL